MTGSKQVGDSVSMFNEGTKRVRRTIDMNTKLELIKRSDNGSSISQICKDFELPTSSVRSILKKRDVLLSMPAVHGPGSSVTSRVRSNNMLELEHILSIWIEEQNELNAPLTGQIIMQRAREIWVDLGADQDESEKPFNASRGWFERFRKRHNIQFIKNSHEPDHIDESSSSKDIN